MLKLVGGEVPSIEQFMKRYHARTLSFNSIFVLLIHRSGRLTILPHCTEYKWVSLPRSSIQAKRALRLENGLQRLLRLVLLSSLYIIASFFEFPICMIAAMLILTVFT